MQDFLNNFKSTEFDYYINSDKKIFVDDIICFDVETTSGFFNGHDVIPFDYNNPKKMQKMEKVACLYKWQCSINKTVYHGRTLDEYYTFLTQLKDHISNEINTDEFKIIIYVHNLAFEFVWMTNIIEFDEVFARQVRKPIYARWDVFEFRCSYMLTRLSLKNWGDSIAYPIAKGTMDYNKIRTPLTRLSMDDIDYCNKDCLVMYHGLLTYKKRYGHVCDIPLTQTGTVRREIIHRMRKEKRYLKKMTDLIPQTIEEFRLLIKVFLGGWTHANYLFSNRIIESVFSADIGSSYPAALVNEKYPMTRFVKTTYNHKFCNNERYSYIITFECRNVTCITHNTFLSYSKVNAKGATLDNGRIMECEWLQCSLTNIDHTIFEKVYRFTDFTVLDFRVAKNSYLNDTFRRFVLEQYTGKTTLKGVKGQEELYMKKKECTNCLFGMACTRTITDDITFNNGEWGKKVLDEKTFLDKTNKQRGRVSRNIIAFQHGVWCTAYARRNLWDIILEIDDRTVYGDTDSDKFIGNDMSFVEKFNRNVLEKNKRAAQSLGLPLSAFAPKDSKGIPKMIGFLEIENNGKPYNEFKTMGAKKYAYTDDNGDIHITISGVSKKAGAIFKSLEEFKEGMVFKEKDLKKYDAEKLTLTYITDQGNITFNKGRYDEYTCTLKNVVHATPTTYELGMSDDYGNLIDSVDIFILTNLFEKEDILRSDDDYEE